MITYKNYIKEIENRKTQGLNPKPIDEENLLNEIINHIKDINHSNRKDSLNFFIYNVIPGTTSAAYVKANFLKDIILNKYLIEEIPSNFAFELLSHMKGGPSIKVLIDLALGTDSSNSEKAVNVLKNQVFLYESDMNQLKCN